ncbi:MAG: cyclodeaminase/cyclohydrolase family protein [Synergistaceae bacterium]|jgi:formiminotetrahydrofolate cyclodeaminase|nr:cyclodeaminase/cyclohydrolase family protein [Synergistaceae bacterium]
MSLIDMTVKGFTEKLASDAPAPGGGSAAALSGALGAGLVSMVCRLTLGKAKYAQHEVLVKEVLAKSDALAASLLDGIQKDTDAFDSVMAAFALPKETDEQKVARSAAIQRAYIIAVDSPVTTAEGCLAAMQLSESLLHKSNTNAVSDLAVGAVQAWAGLKGALANVRINLPSIKDVAFAVEKKEWLERVEREADRLLKTVEDEVAREIGQAS